MQAEFEALRFLNCIVIVETDLTPAVISDAVHAIEERLGRTRGACANLPRTIDIDIIAYDDLCLTTPALTLPHPRAQERRFVLQPLADLRPDYVFPGTRQSIANLLDALPPTPLVTRWCVE